MAHDTREDNVHKDTDTAQENTASDQVAQLNDKYARLMADFTNYRSRVEKERAQWIRDAQAAVIVPLLAIVDDFDRAMADASSGNSDQLRTALTMTHSSLHKLLAQLHVTPITELRTFDPEIHEAIAYVPSPEHAAGDIVQVVKTGYLFKNELLRPAQVIVAQEQQ